MHEHSTIKKKRGRPPKLAKTIEGNRLKEWALEIAKYSNSQPGLDDLTRNLADSYNLREILKDFSPIIPRKILIELYSIDAETPKHEIDRIVTSIDRYQKLDFSGKIRGGTETKRNAGCRAHAVWSKNLDLATQIEQKEITKTAAAKKIFEDWSNLGDKKKKPASIRSITGWYAQYFSMVGKRLVYK